MTHLWVSAVVLAGGRSSRFGRDKLTEPLEGKTLLDHAIDSVRPFANEIIVVVAPDALPVGTRGVRVVHDVAPFEGPLAGLLTGLGAATGTVVLVTAGDMPHLQPGVAEALLEALERGGIEAAVLEDAGRPRPLPMAMSRDPSMRSAQRLIDGGERRLRALVEALTTTVVAEATWRTLDPQGLSLRDIDTPSDMPEVR